MTVRTQGTRLSPEREQEIAELAEAVADEYCPGTRVDPEVIIKTKRITLSLGDYGDAFDGLLECVRGRFHIYANLTRLERADSPRARFTFGHELGHFFIDEHRNALAAGVAASHPSFCEYESELMVEKEADHFSSNLLMPATRFKRLAKDTPVGMEGILRLAAHFGTSVTSTAIRYVRSDFVPCAVIKWGPKGYMWKWLSTETFRSRYLKTVESINSLPPDSPTALAAAGERPPRGGFFSAGTTSATWFPYVDEGGHRDAIMIEQAIQLGRFGVLTFLYPESGSYKSALPPRIF